MKDPRVDEVWSQRTKRIRLPVSVQPTLKEQYVRNCLESKGEEPKTLETKSSAPQPFDNAETSEKAQKEDKDRWEVQVPSDSGSEVSTLAPAYAVTRPQVASLTLATGSSEVLTPRALGVDDGEVVSGGVGLVDESTK